MSGPKNKYMTTKAVTTSSALSHELGCDGPPKYAYLDVLRLAKPHPASFLQDGPCTLLPGIEGTVLDVYDGGARGPHAYGFDYCNGYFDPDAGIYGCNGYEIIHEDAFELLLHYEPKPDPKE